MPVNRSSLVLPSILCIALLLRLPQLNGSFWMDEAAQALESIRPFSQQLDIVRDFQPPLLHYILHFASYLSTSEWFLRTVGSLIPGLGTIYYLYKTGLALTTKRVATVAALLLTTSSLHIFFSQELRQYSLPAFCAALSSYYFLQYREKKQTRSLLLLAIANSLGLYSSYVYPFFLIGQGFLALCLNHRKELFKLAISFGASVVSFLPLMPLFFRQLAEGGVVRSELTGWDQVVSTPQLKALPMVFGKFVFGVLPLDATPFVVLVTLVLIPSLVFLIWQALPNNCTTQHCLQWLRSPIGVLMLSLLVPLTSAWLISFAVPVIQPKRVLYLLPTWYLLIAMLIDTLFDHWQKYLQKPSTISIAQATLLGSIIITNIYTTSAYYTNPLLQRENWRSLHQEIHRDFSRENTALLFAFPAEFAPIAWYERSVEQPFAVIATRTLHIDAVADLDETLKPVVEYQTVLVFDYLRDLTDPERKLEQTLHNFNFTEVDSIDYPHIGFVRVFVQREHILGLL